jgi:hypothetical protein
MPTIAELAQAPVGTPIVGLQAYVSSVYETKPFGQGHMQAVTITDGSAQMLLRVMDGPELVAGMNIQVSALPKEVTVRGQKQMELDGAYTEVYKDKMRFNCKARCLMILAGGPAAPAPPTQSAYQPAPAPGAPVGSPWPGGAAPGPAMASIGQYTGQQPPAYAQAATQPAGPAYGPPAALPPVGSAQRPDPNWFSGQAAETGPSNPAQVFPPAQSAAPAKTPWQPAPKMGEAECRELLEKNFLIFSEHLCLEYGCGSISDLPAEVVAGAMSWSTHLAIAIQRSDVIREPETKEASIGPASDDRPWAQAARPGGNGEPALDAGSEEDEVAFGG